jgi:hypothetical protein
MRGTAGIMLRTSTASGNARVGDVTLNRNSSPSDGIEGLRAALAINAVVLVAQGFIQPCRVPRQTCRSRKQQVGVVKHVAGNIGLCLGLGPKSAAREVAGAAFCPLSLSRRLLSFAGSAGPACDERAAAR